MLVIELGANGLPSTSWPDNDGAWPNAVGIRRWSCSNLTDDIVRGLAVRADGYVYTAANGNDGAIALALTSSGPVVTGSSAGVGTGQDFSAAEDVASTLACAHRCQPFTKSTRAILRLRTV